MKLIRRIGDTKSPQQKRKYFTWLFHCITGVVCSSKSKNSSVTKKELRGAETEDEKEMFDR